MQEDDTLADFSIPYDDSEFGADEPKIKMIPLANKIISDNPLAFWVIYTSAQRGEIFSKIIKEPMAKHPQIMDDTLTQKQVERMIEKNVDDKTDGEDMQSELYEDLYKLISDDRLLSMLTDLYPIIKHEEFSFQIHYRYITWCKIKDFLPKQKQNRENVELSEDIEDMGSAAGVQAQIEKKELNSMLQERLYSLNDTQRIVIFESFFHNKSIKEISEELQIPENTIKSHQRRGLKKLRQIIEKNGKD